VTALANIANETQIVIKFVGDINRAVKFYRDVLDFQLKFESLSGANS
jgi:predicted enzyme related to lactoylglutathione lyase